MQSKTPQFDALLDPILAGLVPHTRKCAWAGKHEYCESDFAIEEEDIEFLRVLRVPPSRYCPTCRRMRRFVHMNLTRLFKRACNAPEHSEQMISILPQQCPFPVYDYGYFTSDEFDPFLFGVDFDEKRSPIEQLFEVRKTFPMPSFLNRDPSSLNSEYSNGGRNSKNCYYTFGVYDSEDVWYSGLTSQSKEVMDSGTLTTCDTVYETFQSEHIFRSVSVYFSKDCSDSYLLYDCRSCQDCFGCVNLRNKRYCIFNEQKTKEEYAAFIAQTVPFSYTKFTELKKQFWDLVRSLPINASRNISVTDVSGVMVDNGRNLFDVTDSNNAEHVRHADGVVSHKDSMDVLFSGGNSELLYQTTNIGSQSSRVKFSVSSKFITDSEFVFNSKNLVHCFMCFGLQNKSYCILNKPYKEEEYWPLVDTMKKSMLERGEYGECVGMPFSAQAYNSSMAGMYFPLPNTVSESLGAYNTELQETNSGTLEKIEAKNLPETIAEVDNSILQKAILCEETGRPFRIIASELAFYRKMKLPLPHIHPVVRSEKRYKITPIGKRYQALCAKCGKEIQSICDPKEGNVLYCESCYQREVA